jgi:hypothetical protein
MQIILNMSISQTFLNINVTLLHKNLDICRKQNFMFSLENMKRNFILFSYDINRVWIQKKTKCKSYVTFLP